MEGCHYLGPAGRVEGVGYVNGYYRAPAVFSECCNGDHFLYRVYRFPALAEAVLVLVGPPYLFEGGLQAFAEYMFEQFTYNVGMVGSNPAKKQDTCYLCGLSGVQGSALVWPLLLPLLGCGVQNPVPDPTEIFPRCPGILEVYNGANGIEHLVEVGIFGAE